VIATGAKPHLGQLGANASFEDVTAIVIVAKRGSTARIAIPLITAFLFMRVIVKNLSI
jgi:hypothetical protein